MTLTDFSYHRKLVMKKQNCLPNNWFLQHSLSFSIHLLFCSVSISSWAKTNLDSISINFDIIKFFINMPHIPYSSLPFLKFVTKFHISTTQSSKTIKFSTWLMLFTNTVHHFFRSLDASHRHCSREAFNHWGSNLKFHELAYTT